MFSLHRLLRLLLSTLFTLVGRKGMRASGDKYSRRSYLSRLHSSKFSVCLLKTPHVTHFLLRVWKYGQDSNVVWQSLILCSRQVASGTQHAARSQVVSSRLQHALIYKLNWVSCSCTEKSRCQFADFHFYLSVSHFPSLSLSIFFPSLFIGQQFVVSLHCLSILSALVFLPFFAVHFTSRLVVFVACFPANALA